MDQKNPRNVGLNILLKVFSDENHLDTCITEESLGKKELDGRDVAFIRCITKGVVERKVTLEAMLDKVTDVKAAKIRPAVKTILYMGMYEILFMNTSDYAAVNEYVKLAKNRGFSGLKGFVNGVLRTVCQNKEVLFDGLSKSERISFPPELWRFLSKQLGTDDLMKIGEFFLSENAKHLTVRRNASKCTDAELKTKAEEEGVTLSNLRLYPGKPDESEDVYVLKTEKSLTELTIFREGLVYPQDVSSSLAGDSVADLFKDTKKPIRVLDLCASPGGKSLHIADIARKNGVPCEIISCDVSEEKLHRIRENIQRTGFGEMTPMVNDGTVYRDEWREAFDLVLSDVPCSGLGVLAGKPDIKLHMNPERIQSLWGLQSDILENAAKYVKKGGTLLYSTCTINREENEIQTKTFFENHPEYESVEAHTFYPGINIIGDGFYYHRMRKHD